MPHRESWGYGQFVLGKKCFCETPYCSHVSINLICIWQVFWRHSVDQELGIAAHQHQCKPLEKVANNLLLLLMLLLDEDTKRLSLGLVGSACV